MQPDQFYMVLQTGFMTPDDWECFLIEAGISTDSAKTQMTKFADEKLTIESLQMLYHSMLKELGVTLMGEALSILKQAKEAKEATAQSTHIQALAAKPPNLNIEMTPQQFRKFRIDWDVFTKITNMPSSQFNIHQYNCADEAAQDAINNSHPNFFTTDPDKLLDMVEALVTQRSNPIVHRLAFASISQGEGEPIQNYLVHLRAVAVDCSFSCPMYEPDLSDIYIKDQIIQGVANDILLADLLAKAGTLKTLKQNVHHAEAFESALRDQTSMAGASDTTSARLSTYCRQKSMPQADKGDTRTNAYPNYEAKPNHQICGGCGGHLHGTPGTGSRQLKCPAWGQACSNCGKPNHLLRVCRAKKVAQVARKGPEANKAAMDTLIAHITFNHMTGTYTAKDTSQIMEIEGYVVPFSPKPDPRQARDIAWNCSTKMAIFPDSGATICLGGLKHFRNMELSTNNLIPSRKVV